MTPMTLDRVARGTCRGRYRGVEGLVHVYPGGTRALDGVDLAIGPGERVAIVGQNGSGKSTLVRHFNGLLRPTEGRVLVDGRDAAGRRVARLAATVGLAFQDPDRQIFAGRVRSEVAFGPRNLGRRGPDARRVPSTRPSRRRASTGDADANPYDLGYSRRKLLALASILAMRTPIVVLDEPTTGQDARGVARIEADRRGARRSRSHRHRDQPRHALRRRVVRPGHRHARRPDRRSTARPTRSSRRRPGRRSHRRFLEPPLAARIGARLGLGSTPTESALVAALVARRVAAPQGASRRGSRGPRTRSRRP